MHSSATQTLTTNPEQHVATGTQTTTAIVARECAPEPTMLAMNDLPDDMEAAQLLLSAGDGSSWMVDADIWNRATQTLPTICDVGLQTPLWGEHDELLDLEL